MSLDFEGEQGINQAKHPKYRVPSAALILEIVEEKPSFTARSAVSARSKMTISPRNYRWIVKEYIGLEKTYRHLKSLRDNGVIDEQTMIEIMKQKVFLEDNIQIVLGHIGKTVVVCNEQLFFGDTLDEAIKQARDKLGDKPYYSETIDFIDYPSPLS